MSNSCQNPTDEFCRRQSESGQLILEYVLLLTVAVAVAIIATTALVSRGDEKGVIILAWQRILIEIGKDPADDPTPPPPK